MAPPERRPADVGRRVDAGRPVLEGGALITLERRVAQEQRRHALRRIAVLVEIDRDGGHAGDREVELGDGRVELPREGQDHPAEAGVYVQPQPVLRREGCDSGHRIALAVGIGRRGGDQHHGVLVDRARHRLHVGDEVRALRHAHHPHAEQVRRLVEGGVGGARHDHLRRGGGGLALPRPVARGLDRHGVGLGPSRGGAAARSVRRVQQVEEHVDDLDLVAVQARVGGAAVERVLVDVHPERLVRDLEHVVAREVGGLEGASGAPGGVVAPEGLHPPLQLFPRAPVGRKGGLAHVGAPEARCGDRPQAHASDSTP